MLAALPLAFIDLFVGLLELISELAKLVSFSFRLFGNIFAGEVILLTVPSLISLVLVLPFMGLEIFVGFVQALIFAALTLAFVTIATTPHGGEGEH
jgi:F-type H+-transporting ATPase subunit a